MRDRTQLSIFPNPNADPNDPKSYNFGPTDQLIATIKGVGAEVIFRLGRSEGSNVEPPEDFDHYAEVAKHIVLHYNRGWANGFRYNIRYWEVWNEPDLGKLFWGGSPEHYFDLYEKIARAVKKADRRALIGGPAIARPNDNNPYVDDFLEVRARPQGAARFLLLALVRHGFERSAGCHSRGPRHARAPGPVRLQENPQRAG